MKKIQQKAQTLLTTGLPLIGILIFGFWIRFIGRFWDHEAHLHPDERMIIMVADTIKFFTQLNPRFFSYGSLPIYILKGSAELSHNFLNQPAANYDTLLVTGRFLSTLADTTVILFVFLVADFVFRNKKIALLASFLYTISFFPIQNAHFYIVDVWLTLFAVILLYLLLHYASRPHWIRLGLIALFAALAVSTKFTAVVFFPLAALVLCLRDVFQKHFVSAFIKIFCFSFLLFGLYFLFMPYAVLDYPNFLKDTTAQIQMNSNAYAFPYTLQYVGSLPYLYHLKNIYLWGLGPIISTLALIGFYLAVRFVLHTIRSRDKEKIDRLVSLLVVVVFYGLYFVLIGRSAVKFMRYLLPLYPLFSVLAAYGLTGIRLSIGKLQLTKLVMSFCIVVSVVWLAGFLNIYKTEHTRSRATKWILANIPAKSTIAVEHWDDRIPLIYSSFFNFQELGMYNLPDDKYKWNTINKQLRSSDYLIIASNRLYTPLSQLNDCSVHFPYCYPKTAQYYKNLFAEKLNFKKVAEFTSYPIWQLGNFKLELKDDTADESFTVYDHPKVMIFKKKGRADNK